MIQRKTNRIAWMAMLAMVCFLFTSLISPFFSSNGSLVEEKSTSYSVPLAAASQAEKQVPLEGNEGNEKEEESRSDRSEQSFLSLISEEVSAYLTLTDISKRTYFVRSVTTSQTWLPLYLAKCSLLI